MERDENIRRFSAAELEARRACGESRTDLARVPAKTEEELERDIASDPDFRNAVLRAYVQEATKRRA